jgi:hypothetical protein
MKRHQVTRTLAMNLSTVLNRQQPHYVEVPFFTRLTRGMYSQIIFMGITTTYHYACLFRRNWYCKRGKILEVFIRLGILIHHKVFIKIASPIYRKIFTRLALSIYHKRYIYHNNIIRLPQNYLKFFRL